METKVLNKLHDINGKLVICECGGEYIFEERVLLTEPPQFPYRCEKCSKRKIQRQNKNIMKLWIARDESGAIFIHRHKPEKRRYGNAGVVWESTDFWQLYHRDYPEVTFENSPQKVELKLI